VDDSNKAAIVRRFVDAFNRRDFDAAIRGLLDPDCELHEWPMAPGARSYHGHDGVREALETWFESWEWMQVEVVEIVDRGDRSLVVLDQRARGRGSQAEVEVRSFNVYTFRAGKVLGMQLFTEREPALEAAGLNPEYEEEKR
jgi:ketosteroid isomerase-like protein